jgi:hypothetical protein
MVSTVIIAVCRAKVENCTPKTLCCLLGSAKPAAEAHEVLVVDGAVCGLSVHHAAKRVNVSPANSPIVPQIRATSTSTGGVGSPVKISVRPPAEA